MKYLGDISDSKDIVNKEYVDSADSNKVDKVSGKGLSTNDYTTAEKNKLAGIAAGAQVNSVTGVKGSTESSYRTGQVSLNATNIGAIPKNEASNTQMLRRPSYLQGANDVTLDSKINTLRANRLAFLPADQIIIEKTTDGGTTWTDAGISDVNKINLFSETRPSIDIPLLNGKKSPLCGLRFTITGMKYNVPSGTAETAKYNYWNSSYIKSTERYCQLKEMYFWVSVSGGYINAKVERATGANPNTWSVIFNDSNFNMTGYSGNDYLSFTQGVFGGGITQTSNFWNYRITLMTDDLIPNPPYDGYAQTIYEIRGYGDTWWSKPNEYMANDKLYTHDYLMNAQFPAMLTATQFNGALNGNASTASLAAQARRLQGTDTRNANNPPSWYISYNAWGIIHEFKTTSAIGVNSILTDWSYCDLITDVYYADASGGLPIQIAISHKGKRAIRYATSTSTWGAWKDLSDADTVNSHTVNSDVPANAKFTDTVTTATTTGTGNAVTAVSASDGALTITKGATFLTSYTETDPTVPSWAKASSKPTYTASEVGAQPTLVSGTNIKTINNQSLLGSGNISISGGTGSQTTWYGTCSTGYANDSKVVTCSGFTLTKGAIISVTFTHGIQADSSITMNVNSTGAKTVVRMNAAMWGVNHIYCGTNALVTFIYDGTYWAFVSSDDDPYPIGSCCITSGENSIKPPGEWELIHKSFKSAWITDAFTFNTTNTTNGSSAILLNGNTIEVRLTWKNKVAISDSSVTIGTFDRAKIGLVTSGEHAVYATGYSDGCNAIGMFMASLADGGNDTLVSYDWVTRATSYPTTTGEACWLNFTFNCRTNQMLDSMCDEFVWKRTA